MKQTFGGPADLARMASERGASLESGRGQARVGRVHEPILQVDGLTKRYGKRKAVDDLSFAVRPGEVFGFLGRNGAGKSTTIRLILGLVRPTSGTVRVAGRRVLCGRRHAPWPVGAIVESPVFYDHLSGRCNVELLASLSGGADRGEIDRVLDLVGLAERQADPVRVYSHGMRQRLGLAQALVPRPALLILDEPLDGLDPNGIRDLRDVMCRVVREEGVTIFLSSHILSEVEMTCSRVLVLHEGAKVFDGATADLVAGTRKVRLRTTDGEVGPELASHLEYVDAVHRDGDGWILTMDHDRVPDLARHLVARGADVLELTPVRERLEDVFIHLTGGPTGDVTPACRAGRVR